MPRSTHRKANGKADVKAVREEANRKAQVEADAEAVQEGKEDANA